MATTAATPDSSDQFEMFSESLFTKMLMSHEKNTEESKTLTRMDRLIRFTLIAGSRYMLIALAVLVHALVFSAGLMFYKNDLDGLRTFKDSGIGGAIANASALVLHFDVAILLLPLCRTLMESMRGTSLRIFFRDDSAISCHKLVAWSIVFFTWVHAMAHWIGFAQLASKNGQGPKGFFLRSFATGPGWSGHIMLLLLMLIAITSIEWARVFKWHHFWSTHHLFILFFITWSIHGTFSQANSEKSLSWTEAANFWQYWLCGGLIYLVERISREVREKHKTRISKIIQHPSNVVEIQIKKRQTVAKVGQHIYLCCPETSAWQWRAFVLTSAPEEDYLAVHIRCCDQFTVSLAASVGCSFEQPKNSTSAETSSVIGIDEKIVKLDVDPTIRNLLPPISINGPFGREYDGLFEKEVAVLVGVGHKVVVLAAILKSIWYRQNFAYEKTALRKVYFFWLCNDLAGLEWFKALVMAIEAQDMDHSIEIHPYLTNRYSTGDAIGVGEKDSDLTDNVFTGLRFPTTIGPPDWNAIFRTVTRLHSPAKRGIYPHGSIELWADLLVMCRKYPQGTS